MSTIARLYDTHPRPVRTSDRRDAECAETCFECAQACTACADACIVEGNAALAQCIRLNLDCADICEVTGRLLARPSHTDATMLRAQLEACVRVCRACGEECRRHEARMEHCRICAEVCDRCAVICQGMIEAVAA